MIATPILLASSIRNRHNRHQIGSQNLAGFNVRAGADLYSDLPQPLEQFLVIMNQTGLYISWSPCPASALSLKKQAY